MLPTDRLTARQAVRLAVRPGHSYEVTKYVGIATGSDSADPHRRAIGAAAAEARLGYAGLRRGSDATASASGSTSPRSTSAVSPGQGIRQGGSG